MTEQFSNNAATTLTSSLDGVVTSVPVASAVNFPGSAQYRVIIDNEIMIITAGAGTLTWTVTRGAEGTTAVAHNNGASVRHTITAGALSNFSQVGGASSRTTMPASYLGTPLTTVFYTAKSADLGTTITARTSTGVTEVSSGLYQYNQPVSSLDTFLAIWDEGNPAVFNEELVVVDKIAPTTVFNVKDYGALGDGSTDDTTAIQAAITAAPATGATIYFPPGIYRTSTTLTITNPSLIFQGAAAWDQNTPTNGSVIRAKSTHTTTLVSALSTANGFSVNDMTLNGELVCPIVLALDGLGSQINRSNIRRCAPSGVCVNVTTNAASLWINPGTRIDGATQTGSTGVRINATDSMMIGVKVVNCVVCVEYQSGASGAQSISCHHTPGNTVGQHVWWINGQPGHVQIVGNRVDNHLSGSAIQVDPTSNIQCLKISDNVFSQNGITDATYAAIGFDTTNATPHKMQVTGNIIRSSSATNRYTYILSAQTRAGASTSATASKFTTGGVNFTNNTGYVSAGTLGNGAAPMVSRGNVATTTSDTSGYALGNEAGILPVYVVASNDASATLKSQANYVCDGTADEVEINQAMADAFAVSLPAGGFTIHGGTVLLVGQQFTIAAPLQLQTGIKLCGTGKSYTTIVPANSTTLSAMVTLAAANTERTELCDLNLNGNAGGGALCDVIHYTNTGSFSISPDSIHRIYNIDMRNASGSGIILDGSTLRGMLLHDIRIQGCAQHGVSVRNASSDHKWMNVTVIGCGTDDATMTYNGWHFAANITGYDGSGHVTFGSTYASGGASQFFANCRADFQKGRGWLIDVTRCRMAACGGFDNWGAGLDMGPNSNGCHIDFSTDSGMFPQATIEGSDSGVYVQGGYHTGDIIAVDRGFASGNLDVNGVYGSTENYGLRFRDNFATGCFFSVTSRNNKTDSITGGRALTGNQTVFLSCDATVSAVQYTNLPLATGGTFTLTFDDTGSNPQTTSAISWNASGTTLASNIQTALRALSNVGGSGVNVTTANFSYQSQVTFAGTLGSKAQLTMTINGASLTGTGATAAAAVLVKINGGVRQSETRLDHGPLYLGVPKGAPLDSLIRTGGISLYEDSSSGNLMARMKKTDGTTFITKDLEALPAGSTPVVIHQPGYKYVVFDSLYATGAAITSGSLYLARVDTDGINSVSNADIIISSVSGIGTLSNCYIAVFNSDGTQHNASTDQSSGFATTGVKSVSFAAYTPAAPFVWVGILINSSGTMPQLARVNATTQPMAQANLTAGLARVAINGTSLTSMSPSITPTSNSQQQSVIWAGLW